MIDPATRTWSRRGETQGTEAVLPDAAHDVPCAICASRQVILVHSKFGYTISRCTRCGLVYASPRAAREDILRRYSAEYFRGEYLPALGVIDGRYDLAFFDRRHAPMLAMLASGAPGRRVLEVGTGAGFFLKAAERAGWRGAGIELSADAAAFARGELKLDVRQERAEEMTFPRSSFDAAVMFDVIEHLFDPRAALDAIRAALAPRGVLVITTPNLDALTHLALGTDWAVISPLEHLYYFRERTLRALLEAVGFHDVRFVRRYAAWGPLETMNYRYTHAPTVFRARLYRAFVETAGRVLYRGVQSLGWADSLLCLAQRGQETAVAGV